MKNVHIDDKGDVLVITVKKDENFGPSSTGKSITVATTEGNQSVGRNKEGKELKLGLNLYFRP